MSEIFRSITKALFLFYVLYFSMSCTNSKSDYPIEINSSQLEQLKKTDLLANCDRKQAISQYQKLLLKESDPPSKNYIHFRMRSLAYVHNLYSIDSIVVDKGYVQSFDELSKILNYTDSLLYATNVSHTITDPYSSQMDKFSIVANIYFFAIGLHYRYDLPNDKIALEFFQKSIDSYNKYGYNRFFCILACVEGIQNAFNAREYNIAHLYGENAYNLSLECKLDSLGLCLGLMARGYGIHTDDKDKCLEYLTKAQEYGNNLDAIVAHQEILKYLSYYHYGVDSLLFKKYLNEFITCSNKYGDKMNLKRSLAYYELQEKKFQDAIKYYHEAIQFYNNKKRFDPALLQTIYLFLSEAYRELGEFDRAIDYRLKGYELFDPKLRNLDTLYFEFNDSIANVNPTINYILGSDISLILSKKFEKSNDIKDLKLALKFMEFSLLPQKSPVQSSDISKELIIFDDYARYYIDRAIPLIYKLYKLTGNQFYINKYIELIAYNKARVSSGINQKIAKEYRINEKLYKKEKYFNSRISLIKSAQNFGHDSLNTWTQELQKIYLEYSKYYPEYICEKDQSKAKSLAYLQSILPKTSAFIQYDIVGDKVFIFYFTKEKAEILVKPYNKTEMLLLNQYQSGEINVDSIYYKLSLEAYKNLIPESIYKTNDFMIVADNELHRLSFDALAINSTKELAIGRHAFCYYTNIDRFNIQTSQVNITNNNTVLFGFSDPETIKNSDNSNVPELSGTYKEIKNIASKLNSDHYYCGLKANKRKFNTYYQNPKIKHLHLAVHGYADDKKQHLAYLLFRNDSSVSKFDTVYTYDIEAMQSSAQSIILSACQTHYGKIMHQEGTITLARSFLINGAHQVISTLWAVDDQSTAHMMDLIYNNKTGINLDVVHNAKRNMYRSGKFSIDQWAGIQVIR